MSRGDILVDFDGTICPNKNHPDYPNYYPPPTPECIQTLKALRMSGKRIIIYSVRSNKDESKDVGLNHKMLEYLVSNKVPFDSVNYNKPHASLVIDDKGLGVPLVDGNVDWVKVKESFGWKEMFSSGCPDVKGVAKDLANLCDGSGEMGPYEDRNYTPPCQPMLSIPVETLKDMGFVWDESISKWVLNVGNPLVWYEIILNESPKWYEFRQALADALFEASEYGGKKR